MGDTSKSVEFISKERTRPFFFMVSIPDPHSPYTVRSPYDAMFDPEDMPLPATLHEADRPNWLRGANDASPGQVVGQGQAEATLLVGLASLLLAGAALAVPPTVISPTPDQVFEQGDSVNLNAAAAFFDAEADDLTFTVTGLPSNLGIDFDSGAIAVEERTATCVEIT